MSPPTKTTTTPPFTLSSPAGTDIWRKPPTHDIFNAPTHPSPLPQFPLSVFQRARIRFSLPPPDTLRQYDQAGLLLHFTYNGDGKEEKKKMDKWIKTGIEFYNGKPYISTVGTDRWSDWSVVPLSSTAPSTPSSAPSSSSGDDGDDGRLKVTIEAKREKDALGKSLWVYEICEDRDGKEERRPLREMNWVFAEEEGWSVGVGGYVARPNEDKVEAGEELCAEFEGVEVEVSEG